MDGGTLGLKKMHLYFQQHVTLFLCHNLKKKFEVGSLKRVAPQHSVKWHTEEWHLAGRHSAQLRTCSNLERSIVVTLCIKNT